MKKESYNMRIWLKKVGFILAATVIMIKPARAQNISKDNGNSLYAKASERFPNIIIPQDGKVPAALKRAVSLHYESMSLKEALQDIAQKAGFRLVYNDQRVPLEKKITLNLNGVTINEALLKILKGTGLQYALSANKHLVLVERHAPSLQVAQETITGTVTDAQSGETLPGVNILVKGTSNGTSTDTNGHYELSVTSLQDTLVFSYIGYKTREVPLNGQATLNVRLKTQAISGEEVVVVGYGTQKKSDLTGSVSSISSKDFNPGVNTSVDQLLQGRSAGVQISQISGEPGAGVSVRIRGASSINAGNGPLYVIDGLPIDNSASLSAGGVAGLGRIQNRRNPLNSLNPNDIASIEILKDASATAIYGSRGANGVVLITTKKGKAGEIQINYNGYIGVQATSKRLNILSNTEYINAINGISEDAGNGLVFSESDIDEIGNGTNWQDQIYQNAPVTNQNLSFSGGDESTTYRASLNYFNQEGVLKNTGIKKYIAKLNLERTYKEKIKMGINLNHSLVENNNGIDNVQTNERQGPINASIDYDPTEPIYNADGSFKRSPNITVNNPVSLLKGVNNTSNTNRTFGNAYIQYDIMKDFNAKLNFGYDRQANERDIYNSRLTITGDAANGIANIGNLNRTNTDIEYTMNFDRQLNESNSIKVLGGITYQRFSNKSFIGNISGFPTDGLKTNNLGLGDTGNDNLNSHKEVNKLLSYLGRINYNLYDKYLLTASFRADGSSRFGENNKFGYFPSFALAWKMSEENFIPQFFNQLKLRASWGVTGNQEIGNYNYLSTFVPGANYIVNDKVVSSINPSRVANPNLKWESTRQFNVGVDASVLKGRLSGTIDYYINNTNDLLINQPLPISSGYGSILLNSGKTESKGIEIQLSSTNISTQNFTWNTTLNFASRSNNVKSLGGGGDIITGSVSALPNTTIFRVGESFASYYGYEVTGIFQKGDDIAASAQPSAKPGYPIFKDVNEDNQITPADRVILGNPYPNFTYGIQNSLSFKNFQLDFFIQGQQGADLINVNRIRAVYPLNFRNNRLATPIINRWTPESTHTKWPAAVNSSAYEGGKVNSLFVENASYLQLKTVRLNYHIPQNFIRSASIYVTGQNLVTITDYSGVNPEASALGGRNNARLDYNAYPLARSFLFGINIGI